MYWDIVVFRAGRYRRPLARLGLVLAVGALLVAALALSASNRHYTLTVRVQPPYVAEGVEVYHGCCRIVDQQSGDNRTFVFDLQGGDYNIGAMMVEDGESRPMPSQPVPIHLDHDQTITLYGTPP